MRSRYRAWGWALAGTCILIACGAEGSEQPEFTVTTSTATETSTETSTGSETTAGESDASSTGADDTTSGSTTTGPILDVGGATSESSGGEGCEKVDFLFVIDNSGSMLDDQQKLIASFDGFISAIEAQVVSDYRILVTDTDAAAHDYTEIVTGCTTSGNCECWGSPDAFCECIPFRDCCEDACLQLQGVIDTCNQRPCGNLGDPPPPLETCDATLGAGRVRDRFEFSCDIQGSSRWLEHDEPGLAQDFACLAETGTEGEMIESSMGAVLGALTTQNEPGACNAGFLRDDAILVITIITDEDDNATPGSPSDWVQSIAAAKSGDETAVVSIALTEEADGCGGTEADRIVEFVNGFTHGSLGDICEDDYAQIFAEAISVIETACDEFIPPD